MNKPEVAVDVIDLDQGGVIHIGEPMDPDDPSTWPVDENTEVISIGERLISLTAPQPDGR